MLPKPDSLSRRVSKPDSIGFRLFKEGRVQTAIPAQTNALEAVRLLADVPHSAIYDLGGMYLPHDYSIYGVSASNTSLTLNGLPFQSVFSHRTSLFHLLPLSWISSFRISEGAFGEMSGVNVALREFRQRAPYTEIRYDTGSNGLQSGSGLHSQVRNVKWFKKPANLQFTFGMNAKKARNEYANADAIGYNTLIRLRYERPKYSLEFIELNSRQRNGNNGGAKALPETDLTTLFDRDLQSVNEASLRNEIIRNDLSLTYRKRFFGAKSQPMNVIAFHQAQTDRQIGYLFTTARKDTTSQAGARFGVSVQQGFRVSKHRLNASFFTWTQTQSQQFESQTLQIALDDSLQIKNVLFSARVGLGWQINATDETTWLPQIRMGIKFPNLFFWRIWMGNIAANNVETSNFVQRSYISEIEKMWLKKDFPFQFGASGFYRYDAAISAIQHEGVYAKIFWQEYPNKSPNWWALGKVGFMRSHSTTKTQSYLDASLRGGLRFNAFQNDLIANVSAQVRYTSFHPFAENTLSDLKTQNGILLDVYGNARVRSAEFFLTFENILSGTALQRGVMLLPNYPLLDQQFRFGVIWALDG